MHSDPLIIRKYLLSDPDLGNGVIVKSEHPLSSLYVLEIIPASSMIKHLLNNKHNSF
jgi:hypothetical protein